MLWQPAPAPVQPRVRTPRQFYQSRPTFRTRLLALFDHLSAVSAPQVARAFGINLRLATVHLWRLVQCGDLCRVRVPARSHRCEYRRVR